MTFFCDTHPAVPAMSITPGTDAVFEAGRALDDQDGRHPAPVVVEPATRDRCLCWDCWRRVFVRTATIGAVA